MNSYQKILNHPRPLVMGILNATPDSFYNKGKNSDIDSLMTVATNMITEGASIIDIGGMSSRPNSVEISIEEELERVIPVVISLRQINPSVMISVDTYRSKVARQAMKAGANIINDISGSSLDEHIIDVAIEFDATYICMHMKGNPQNMQINPQYDDVIQEVYSFFEDKINSFSKKEWKKIILDVGFGFGKTISHNYALLKNLSQFNKLGKPLLAGLSRKSMIYKPLGTNAEQALNGTTALNMIALEEGAKIIRVHDVREAVECVKLHSMCL